MPAKQKAKVLPGPKPQEARAARYNPAYRLAFGDHVEHVVGRLFVRPVDETGDYERHIIAGAVIGHLPVAIDQQEMWECDIILIPRRRWRDPVPGFIKHGRMDQVLCGGYNEEGSYREVVPVVEGEENWKQEAQPNPDIHEHWTEEEPRPRRRKK